MKELQEKEKEIKQLKEDSRDATQVHTQLREEIRLQEEYARQLSDAQVTLSEEREKFETDVHEKRSSMEQVEKKFLDMEGLLQQE